MRKTTGRRESEGGSRAERINEASQERDRRPLPPALEMIGVTKTFSGAIANDNVDFVLRQGEIHALLGENGAGKTTLMKIAYGIYRPQKGEIRVFGKPEKLENASRAIEMGIGMVHQHFTLVPAMTVAENIMLGSETLKYGPFLDMKKVAERIGRLSEKFGMEIDPFARVETLPVGLRQRVEILKTLFRDARILILDEPTAVLAPGEAENLFSALKDLAKSGRSVVFITHKLDEVMAAADRITVLRHGRVEKTLAPGQTSRKELIALMVGKQLSSAMEKKEYCPGRPVLRVENLSVENEGGEGLAVDSATFAVREGEILGIAGVQGNGQTQLVEALAGLRRCAGGKVFLDEKEVTGSPPRRIIEGGAAHIPEDRHRHGMVESFSVARNLVLTTIRSRPFSRRGVLNHAAIFENALKLEKDFDIRASGVGAMAKELSGGNQQKMVAAREMSRPVKLLIASQPTRGIDVGAADLIRRRILKMRDDGCAVLLVSAELDELFCLADRIAVMYEGKIVGEVFRREADRQAIGLWMAGGG